jgi:hypothetical protein
MAEVHRAAAAAGVPAPAGAAAWTDWAQGLRAVAEGRLADGEKASSGSALRAALQSRLQVGRGSL